MGCCGLIIILAFPRVALVCLFFFTHYLERAYHGFLLPLLGFFFLPLTTLTYAWLINSHMPIEGINVLFLIIAVLLDAGGLGGGAYQKNRR